LCVIFSPSNIFKNNVVYQYDPDSPARVGLLRRGAITDRSVYGASQTQQRCDDHSLHQLRRVPVEWFLLEQKCVSFHVLNAFEDETTGDVVVDIVVYRGPHVDVDLARFVANAARHGHRHDETGGKLVRWVMRQGEVLIQERNPLPRYSFEFPVINNAVCGQRHGFGYCATSGFAGDTHAFDLEFRGITKIDFSDMSVKEWRTDQGERNDEFVFVPRASATSEDDGYLVGYTVCAGAQSSNLVVLDAVSMRVVCRLKLPQRVPHGFHGTWIPPACFS
jgi:carotenoid cleavage dioxygenase